MPFAQNDGRASIGELLRELAGGSAHLVKQEARLARLEITELLRALGSGTAKIAIGGVLVVIGAIALITGLVLLAGDQWLRDRYWLAALIVTVIFAAIALYMARRGSTLLTAKQLVPADTVATLKEDKEWLRQQLTSGATSR
jgi:hypothetical protein